MYAAFIAPEVILTITGNHPGGKGGTVMCKFLTAGILAWIGGFSSMVTLVVIAFERYFAVMYPYNNQRLTKGKLKVRQMNASCSEQARILQTLHKQVLFSTMRVNDRM